MVWFVEALRGAELGQTSRPRTSLRRWPCATGEWPARQPKKQSKVFLLTLAAGASLKLEPELGLIPPRAADSLLFQPTTHVRKTAQWTGMKRHFSVRCGQGEAFETFTRLISRIFFGGFLAVNSSFL